MDSMTVEGTHTCVRCGHGNAADASFCVECGFDLQSTLQKDYDSYRQSSRGEGTVTEGDLLPSELNSTLTGAPAAMAHGTETILGSDAVSWSLPEKKEPESAAVHQLAPAPMEAAPPSPDEPADWTQEEASDLSLEAIELDTEENDPFAPLPAEEASVPKSRPVHENLKKGVSTYVHDSQGSFRRRDAPDEGRSPLLLATLALVVGLIITFVIMVLTR